LPLDQGATSETMIAALAKLAKVDRPATSAMLERFMALSSRVL
jgi:hypothetical protein